MNLRLLLAFGGLLLTLGQALADEPPHLEFVQGLRARGLPDLALEYLLKLSKKPPPDLAQALPMEIARTHVDMAQLESDPAKREGIYVQASAEFIAFLKANPKSPVAAEATLELARIVALQGKLLAARAEKQEAAEDRKAGMSRARAQFEEAGKRYQEAGALVAGQLARPDLADKDKRSLHRAQVRVDLELGVNYLDQAQTYDDQQALTRGDTTKKALEVLKKIGEGDGKNALYWEAQAWIGRYYCDIDSIQEAAKQLDKVIKATGPQIEPGKRLARYFNVMLLDKETDPKKDPLKLKVHAAEEWLKDYPSYKDTPEGCGVRFQLAEGYLNQAVKRPKSAQTSREVQDLYARAERIFAGLEGSEGEFARKAHDRKMFSIITRSGERSKGDITKLKDFDENYLRAQVEIYTLREEGKNPPKKATLEDLKKKHAQHIDNIIYVLNRALELADAKTSVADLSEARYILAYVYLKEKDDPYRTAIIGEDLARTNPSASRAGAAAAYALQAYAQILAEDEARAGSPEDVEAGRKRLRGLARYMEKTWPSEPATDVARHQLGALLLREKKYPEALAELSKIGPSYGAYSLSQYQLANAALLAQKDGKQPDKGQRPFQVQALAALQSIPDLASGADAMAAQVYFLSKLDLAKLLFAAKQYDRMAALTAQLKKRYEGLNLDAKDKESFEKEIVPTLNVLPVYAQYGQADTQFRAGQFAEVPKLIDPIVDQIIHDKLPDLKDPAVVRGIMGLAMRAHVRTGNTKRAQEILNHLLASKGGSDLEGTAAILGELVFQLRTQIDELRQKGPDAKAELDSTVNSFSAFLDDIAKQPAEKLSPDLVRFSAFSYASLHKHDQAAALLASIPAPQPAAGQAKVEPEKLAVYRSLRLMYIRELRLGKKFDQAAKLLKEEIFSQDWGRKSLDAKKELNCLWEDQEKYPAAAKSWNDLMSSLRPSIEKNNKFKDLYFESYYHYVFCVYKAGVKAKNTDYIRRAANLINNLKKSKPDMGGDALKKQYEELLQQESPLKEMCDKLEQEAKGS